MEYQASSQGPQLLFLDHRTASSANQVTFFGHQSQLVETMKFATIASLLAAPFLALADCESSPPRSGMRWTEPD